MPMGKEHSCREHDAAMDEFWEILYAVIHPTQLLILHAMAWIDEPVSPIVLVSVLKGGEGSLQLGSISYHVRALDGTDDEKPSPRRPLRLHSKRQVRGSVEHFYTLVPSLLSPGA